MVRSEQVFDEKISSTTYAATFSISFAKDFVEHILAQKNQASPEPVAAPVEEKTGSVVIPVRILQRKTLLWEGSNDWRTSVRKALYGHDDFVIPTPDSENIAIVNGANVNQVSKEELAPLFSKYQSSAIYFLLFSFDNVNNKVSVTVRSFNKLHKSQARLSFVNSEKLDDQELMDKVASKSVEYLLGLKNSEKTFDGERVLALEIPITKLGDWLMIKGRIEGNSLISKLNIESISADYVKASVTVITPPDVDIADSFARIGFDLTQKNSNIYLLTIK